MDCRKHYCDGICGTLHLHVQCRAIVEFRIQECKRLAERECWEDPKSVICKTKTAKKTFVWSYCIIGMSLATA